MLGITFVVLIFILLQREDLRDRMIRLFGSSDLHRTTAAMDDAARRLSRFYLTQLALNAAFGVWTSAGLWIIGVPSPVLWGILTALLRFVPYVGSFIAALLPIGLAAAVDPGWSMMLWTATLFIVSEPFMGHVVEPFVYGKSTGLSPFSVVVSAIFWTWLWGPIGLLIATPLTLCLVVLGRHVERLEFFDVLLGDRPALSPAENFYQRMLAGDPDEALEHAEQLLKERSLSSYYDEVALKGLQLAANDAARDVLAPAQIERIKEAIKGLVHDLGSVPDAEPPKEEEEAEPVAAPHRREGAGEGAAGRGAGAGRRGAARELARRGADHVHRRPRRARRGGGDDAGAAPAQARARRPRRAARGGVALEHHRARHQGRRDGVRVLPRDQGQPGAPALSPAAPAPEGRRRPDPRRPVAGRGAGDDG